MKAWISPFPFLRLKFSVHDTSNTVLRTRCRAGAEIGMNKATGWEDFREKEKPEQHFEG